MYNSEKPNLEDLPSTSQLLKSTLIAAAAAIVILITIILPSEYGIDPTGIGKAIGLAEMGEIKTQLAEEAEADRQRDMQKTMDEDRQSGLGDAIFALIFPSALAQSTEAEWNDRYSVTLSPSEGIELKLAMQEGAQVEYQWTAENGVINFDLHGDGGGENISYEKGRAVASGQGVLTAAFTGNHGWFWRNRDRQDVTVTLLVRGDYDAVTER